MSSPRLALPSELRSVQPWRGALALAMDWLLVAACFSAAIRFDHPLVLLGAAVLIARTQLALAVLMHESAHGLLLRPRWLNDAIGQLFTAGPLMVSLPAYRHGHLEHHRAPMAANDPVATIFQVNDYPVSRRQLAWRLLRDLCAIGYLLTVRDFARGKFSHLSKPAPQTASAKLAICGTILLANGTMLAILWASGRPALYLLLWVLPMLTLFQLFARVRAITEHAGYGPNDDQVRNARSIVAPSWQTFVCGPHAIHYHIEHHAHAGVPFYRLGEVHRLMRARGELPESNLYRNYPEVLRDVSAPAAPAPAPSLETP